MEQTKPEAHSDSTRSDESLPVNQVHSTGLFLGNRLARRSASPRVHGVDGVRSDAANRRLTLDTPRLGGRSCVGRAGTSATVTLQSSKELVLPAEACLNSSPNFGSASPVVSVAISQMRPD